MPSPSFVLTPVQFQRITRAIAEPTRYEILRRIFASAETIHCGAAACDLRISPATGSHHLRELEAADLIQVRKEGRFRQLTPRRDVWEAYLAQLAQM